MEMYGKNTPVYIYMNGVIGMYIHLNCIFYSYIYVLLYEQQCRITTQTTYARGILNALAMT